MASEEESTDNADMLSKTTDMSRTAYDIRDRLLNAKLSQHWQLTDASASWQIRAGRVQFLDHTTPEVSNVSFSAKNLIIGILSGQISEGTSGENFIINYPHFPKGGDNSLSRTAIILPVDKVIGLICDSAAVDGIALSTKQVIEMVDHYISLGRDNPDICRRDSAAQLLSSELHKKHEKELEGRLTEVMVRMRKTTEELRWVSEKLQQALNGSERVPPSSLDTVVLD